MKNILWGIFLSFAVAACCCPHKKTSEKETNVYGYKHVPKRAIASFIKQTNLVPGDKLVTPFPVQLRQKVATNTAELAPDPFFSEERHEYEEGLPFVYFTDTDRVFGRCYLYLAENPIESPHTIAARTPLQFVRYDKKDPMKAYFTSKGETYAVKCLGGTKNVTIVTKTKFTRELAKNLEYFSDFYFIPSGTQVRFVNIE